MTKLSPFSSIMSANCVVMYPDSADAGGMGCQIMEKHAVVIVDYLDEHHWDVKMSCSNIVSNIQVSVVTNVPQNFLFQVTLGFDIYSEIFLGGLC